MSELPYNLESKKRRLWPKIRFVNYHASFPFTKGIWLKWFGHELLWHKQVWIITVRHFGIILDFRGNWLADMVRR